MTTDDHTPDDGAAEQRKQADQTTDHGADQPGAPGDWSTHHTGASTHRAPADDGHDWSTYDGPVWSATEAARRSTVSRSTLTRRLASGTIPGATRDADGWRIPALGLALAGIAANTPPDAPAPDDRSTGRADHTPTDTADDTGAASAQVAVLTAQLAAERARREGAERLADERAARITDLQTALRALAPPPPADDSTDSAAGDQDDDRTDGRARSASSPGHGTPTAPPTAQTAAQTTTPGPAASPQPRRGLFARLRDALTAD